MTKGKIPFNVVECFDLPESPDPNTVYRMLPKNPDEEFYRERIDRNIGWITKEEQEMLRAKAIGIAGCGGMGGLLAQICVRLGMGEIHIADCEVFDVSNLNRQFAARRDTLGVSKAFSTARALRAISDDCTLVVYPQGISKDTVEQFLAPCDVVCDEIEFWAVGARILLHQQARMKGVPIFNCNTIGFGTRCFFFTPTSGTMEECLGMTYEKASMIQSRIQNKSATKEEIRFVMDRVIDGLLPELSEYCDDKDFSNRESFYTRVFQEGKAPIIATNPPMATGFLADRILLYLLKSSSVKRDIVDVPAMPGYLYFDAAKMEAKTITESWWSHKEKPWEDVRGTVHVDIATAPEDIDAIYRLRYDIYCHEMGSLYAEDYPNKKETDWYDQYSTYIVAKVGSDVIGALRLIKNTPRGHLMEQEFPLPDWIDSDKAVEHSRGVMRKDYRGKGIFRLILDKAYEWQRQNGYPICVGTPVMNTLGPIIVKDGWRPLDDKETVYHNIITIPMYFYLDDKENPKKK